MPCRLRSLIAVLSVAASLMLGDNALRRSFAQPPPPLPKARIIDAHVQLSDYQQPLQEEKPPTPSESMLKDMPKDAWENRQRIPPGFFGPESPQPDFAKGHFISSDLPASGQMVLPTTSPSLCDSPVCGPPSCGPLGGRLGGSLNFFPRLTNYVFNPPERHRDMGQPLTRQSWRYRPFGLGAFVGFINGGELIDDWVGSDSGTLAGFRLSWDPGYYWGCEFRYAATSMGVWDSLSAKNALLAAERTYDGHRDVTLELWDFSLLWYPWGDTTWRPYALVGLGGSQHRFEDCFFEHWAQQGFAMPLALGLKYRYNSRIAFRFELADNIVFASGPINALHHFSITGGIEMRFGGHRKAYWPWSPGRYYW